MKTPLHDAVRDYIEKDMSRFHMPGHKGAGTDEFAALLPWDITEVEGADSLYPVSYTHLTLPTILRV